MLFSPSTSVVLGFALLMSSAQKTQAEGDYCLLVQTGTKNNYDGGPLLVSIDTGSGYSTLTNSTTFNDLGSIVVQECYPSPFTVKVQAPSEDGWVGNIMSSTNGGIGHAPMVCDETCSPTGGSTIDFYVDGKHSPDAANNANGHCTYGEVCTLKMDRTIPSWIVQHESTIANFNATNDEEEITLVYTIGKNRVARPTLYKEDCETPLDVAVDSDSFDGISLGADPTTSDIEGDPDNSKYEVFLNVMKNAAVLDDLLSKNGTLLSFCSKVALLGSDGTTEIKKNETNIAITLNFTNTFSVDDISLKQIYVGQDNVTTNVLEYVEACACADGKSDDGRECITDPPAIAVDETVKVCVSSKSPEMEIAYLDRLYLQGSGDEVLTIVQDGDWDWENGMASVVSYAAEVWNGVFAEGVVPSSYYSYQGDVPVTVTGTVILKLAGSRRRIAVELGHKDESEEVHVATIGAGASSRALQSAEDQQKSAFAVNFALQKSELELSDADVNGATAGASVSGFGFVAATIGTISSVVAAIVVWWE